MSAAEAGSDGPVRVLLVRHGETSSNLAGLLDTADPGAGLTDLGRHQAEALVTRLATETVDAVLSSPLLRTRQTATPLAAARALPAVLDERVREVRAGDLEMRGDPASMRTYLETVLAWAGGDLDVRVPGGESGHEAFARFDAALAGAIDRGARHLVVVSHGAMIRSWCAARAGVPFTVFAAHPVPNAGIVGLAGRPGAWTVRSWAGRSLDELVGAAHGSRAATE